MPNTLLQQQFSITSSILDKIIEIHQRPHVDIVDFQTLAVAAGVTPTDSTTLGAIQQALGLADSNTIQDAINAAS